MRAAFVVAAVLACATGCASSGTPAVKAPETTLGRVIVYRNGVAYFERYAHLEGDSLNLKVPAERVDDFLKSLTVTDAKTGTPAPIAYKTPTPGEQGVVDMTIRVNGPSRDLKLTYVSEAPAWKPSYRVNVNKDGSLHLQAWAIVDNNSAEDWTNVRLGVGSSSALSFRYDLRSVKMVGRETLSSNNLFALAPPTGESSYGRKSNEERQVVSDLFDTMLDDEQSRMADLRSSTNTPGSGKIHASRKPLQQPSPSRDPHGHAQGHGRGGLSAAAPMAPPAASESPEIPAKEKSALAHLADRARRSPNTIIIEGYAAKDDADKQGAALARANKVRERLVRDGVDPNRIVAVAKGERDKGGVQVVETPKPSPSAGPTSISPPAIEGPLEPIGQAHFESDGPTTVKTNSSAMVSILAANTKGNVVYLYDPESPRGNKQYPFRSLKIHNPTDCVLESGPFAVFGADRFVGEGLAEPIPAKSTAFVPFALDRQLVVEEKDETADSILRILTVQRGVFSSEVQHKKIRNYTIYNRSHEPADIYVRHTVAQGYTLGKAPEAFEKVNGSHLFRVSVPAGDKTTVAIEEHTPVYKTADIRTTEGLELVRAYLSAQARHELREKVDAVLKEQREMANTEQRISTKRDQMDEYRQRMDELHAQLFTLKAVKTAGPLMHNLEKKLQEVSDKLSKATIDIVGLQEKLMVARIHLQDVVAELTLEQPPEKATAVAVTK